MRALQRRPAEELPHLLIGVDDLSGRAENAHEDILFSSRPHMTRVGKLPERDFGVVATISKDEACSRMAVRLLVGSAILDRRLL